MEELKEIKLYEEILARLTTVRDGWNHKSVWNNKLGSSFLDLYVDDYKERLNKIYKQ